MSNDITLQELLLEFQPFSDQIINWCKINPEFLIALKIVHPDKFISPAVVMLSYPSTGDEVIGVYSYHHTIKTPIFKQDYIVNVSRNNKEFILYTRNPRGSSKYVKDIGEFFAKYEQYGYKRADHHLTLEELPQSIRERALSSIGLATKVKDLDIQHIARDEINRLYYEARELKAQNKALEIVKLINDS